MRSAPDGSTVAHNKPISRCECPIKGYEAVWGALLDDVVCGRPVGHNGQHRSVQSLERERTKRRWERYSEQRIQKRRRAKLARSLREIDGYGGSRS